LTPLIVGRPRRGVFLSLILVNELLGVDFPPERLAALKPADWTPQALAWARQRLFQEEPAQSTDFLKLMDKTAHSARLHALLHGIFPPRLVMTQLYGFPSASWQTTARYLPYAAGSIRRYWAASYAGCGVIHVRKRPRKSTLALRAWLGINE